MKTLLTTLFLVLSISVFGQQWLGSSGSSSDIYRNGNLGVGTTAPSYTVEGGYTLGSAIAIGTNGVAGWDGTEGSKLCTDLNFLGYLNRVTARIRSWDECNSTGSGHLSFYTNNTANPVERMRIDGMGNIGIGTTPSYKFDVNAGTTEIGARIFNGANYINIGGIGSGTSYIKGYESKFVFGNIYQYGATILYAGGTEKMRIDYLGNVGIGAMPATGYKLNVNGSIHAKEVVINMTGYTPFPDFVFEDSYILPKIQDVDNYIQLNGHLPNIPSAKEVEKNGLNMADMQVKLLQKVEELTLYMISQQKEIDSLKKALAKAEK